MHFVIAYDITEDITRNKAADLLKDYGTRIQYSVFEFSMEEQEFQEMFSLLRDLIDIGTDRIHAYRICRNCLSSSESYGNVVQRNESDFRIL